LIELDAADATARHRVPKSIDLGRLKVAIIHYWFVDVVRGGEKVIQALCELFPGADVFTHLIDRRKFPELVAHHKIHTSFIQHLPFARRAIQLYLPLMPLALEQFDLSNYDLIVSSESGPAKGVLAREDSLHICYCHSPMRYIWNKHAEYARSMPVALSWPMRLAAHYLRLVDYASAARVDHFVANSTAVARRIETYYRRPSQIVFPPVDVSAFEPAEEEGYYLYCGQLTAYKRPDLAVDCFNELGLPLKIIGDGEMRRALSKRAKSNIRFLGRASDEAVRYNLARCRALVFPGEEDFGIVPVEAMASGRPVIAYARGGALDTVVDGTTGVLFREASVAGLAAAVRRFEKIRHIFDSVTIVRHASAFDKSRFMRRMTSLVQQALAAQSRSRTEITYPDGLSLGPGALAAVSLEPQADDETAL
jgi:glycosyltransferase involved in cell wall biosynthesis